MGMYTSLHLTVELKSNTPHDVLEILNYMTGAASELQAHVDTSHALFNLSDGRWKFMLQGWSYYFPHTQHSSLAPRGYGAAARPVLFVECDFKNYQDEISHFLDWLEPFVDPDLTDSFVGYTRYECDEHPTLIYFRNNKFTLRRIEAE